ncbi:DUF6194 family protein [Prauserella cavernicola]|uniref:DUF6194 domain-containing protein n=1 Tax=Prauserella cavernicola TaxID=2800127 RepID=A0A934V374_9PSEU|nr:DUF6194 family protein [Prauserella cavernicola]MBK1783324.1 hypothetical protein [Prauserella cavernicola]
MNAEELNRHVVESLEGVRVLEGNGDLFYVHDPAGDLPPERQLPFATIVTGNNYDHVSDLDRPGAYRVNIGLPKAGYTARFGAPPAVRDEHGVLDTGYDYAARDTVQPHPAYASQYWVCVVDPGEATLRTVKDLLAEAHAFAARKHANRLARRAD